MITNKSVSDGLFASCRRPPVPDKLGSFAIMQVDLENYTGVARPGDPVQNGEAPVLRMFGVTDNV
jgi:DNA polymerase delta subunit 1